MVCKRQSLGYMEYSPKILFLTALDWRCIQCNIRERHSTVILSLECIAFKERITVTVLRDGNLWRHAESSSESGNRIFRKFIWYCMTHIWQFYCSAADYNASLSNPHGAVHSSTKQNTVNCCLLMNIM
jgi:hypothetical protein